MGTHGPVSYNSAQSYVNNSTNLGYNDWVIPTVSEILELFDVLGPNSCGGSSIMDFNYGHSYITSETGCPGFTRCNIFCQGNTSCGQLANGCNDNMFRVQPIRTDV